MKYDDYKKQINDLAKEDQEIRFRIFAKEKISEEEEKELEEIDKRSTDFIKEVVKEIGLPTISKVGKDASFNSWLLVQHSPDLDFQKEYLKLLKENKDDVKLANIAYLEDRVLMYEKKPQLYGTQFRFNEDSQKMEPYTIQDPENVNKRRKEYGMDTLEEHIKECYS